MKRILALLCFVIFALDVNAQHQYKLVREESGHYYINTTINSIAAHVMLESALPAFLVGRDWYERHLKDHGLPFAVSQDKIRLMADVHTVCMKAYGVIRVGDNVF